MTPFRPALLICLSLFLCETRPAIANQTGEDCKPNQFMKLTDKVLPSRAAEGLKERLSDTVRQAVCNENGEVDPRAVSTRYRAQKFYEYIGTGTFIGTPTITWNGFDEATEKPSFHYEKSSFAYVTAEGRKITPGTMNTDGGTTPRALHATKKFAPWMFGPAYIIHDWIFVAYECNIKPDNDIDFEQSALILAEAIKTLMEKGFTKVDGKTQRLPKSPQTVYLIYEAVRSKIALKMWDDNSGTNCL